jgi:hypothetical protein
VADAQWINGETQRNRKRGAEQQCRQENDGDSGDEEPRTHPE